MKNILWVTATATALTACGGGGSGAGGGEAAAWAAIAQEAHLAPADTAPPPPVEVPAAAVPTGSEATATPALPPAPMADARALSYRVENWGDLFSREYMETRIAVNGADGYRDALGISFYKVEAAGGERIEIPLYFRIFVKEDGASTHTYRWLSVPGTVDELADQLNGQGAQGFRYAQRYFIKSGTSSFSYRVLPVGEESTAEMLAQAKAQGAQGYYYLGIQISFGAQKVRVYQKESQGTPSYDYESLPTPSSEADLLAQMNTQGARGFRAKTTYSMGAEGLMTLYEKDVRQSASFTYYLLPWQQDADALAGQANIEGSSGSVLVGLRQIGSETKALYVKPLNCGGLLCTY